MATELYKVKPSHGKCEVILYSPEHTVTLPELSVPHVRKLVDLWTERYTELKKDPENKYIFIFENRGAVVGVTMPHPHGQIYAYPFVPKRLELELAASKEHFEQTAAACCAICSMTRWRRAAALLSRTTTLCVFAVLQRVSVRHVYHQQGA